MVVSISTNTETVMERSEALDIVRKNWPDGRHQLSEALCILIPELKEGEDERIRNFVIDELCALMAKESNEGGKGSDRYEELQMAKSWLEKQGSQNLANSEKTCKDEQKPVDKVEPKFKVGDWVTNSIDVGKIIGIDLEDENYLFENGRKSDMSVIGSTRHIWTIQDAKDGDVLVTQGSVFIFKHIDKTGRSLCKSYCEVIGNSGLGLGFEFSINDVYPATKEQRDLLFQKMKEAGYEWDAEKKELRKLEQNLAWSEEDEGTLNSILNDLSQDVIPDKEDIQWLKSLKQRYTWKPSACAFLDMVDD